MPFYRVDKNRESGDLRAAICPDASCPNHTAPNYGRTSIRRWGWFVRVERWDWECPACLQEERYWMLLVA